MNTLSFQKHITSQEVTADGLKGLGPVRAQNKEIVSFASFCGAVQALWRGTYQPPEPQVFRLSDRPLAFQECEINGDDLSKTYFAPSQRVSRYALALSLCHPPAPLRCDPPCAIPCADLHAALRDTGKLHGFACTSTSPDLGSSGSAEQELSSEVKRPV